jgi:TM2 domain-containing membrane protein YozV
MPANPLTDPNWATETTDTLVSFIDTVRTKTTQNIVYAARAVVFGLIAVIVGAFAFGLLLIILTRGIQALLELTTTWERAVYLSYLIVGSLFCLISIVLFKKRNAASS